MLSVAQQLDVIVSLSLQVVDKDADAVLDEVEAAIYLIASSILKGEGFRWIAVPFISMQK